MELLLSAVALLADADEPARLSVDEAAPPSPTPPPSIAPSPPPGSSVRPPGPVSTPWPAALAGLVDADLLAEVPADVAELLRLLPYADLYIQDEIDIRWHPTVTRVWSRKGRRGQRRVRAPGQNAKVVASGAVDWRDGWLSFGFGLKRTAELFVKQVDHLVARSQARGRIALVLVDNARTHTPHGAKRVREALERHGEHLRLVCTPAYDPEANPIERLWPPFRRAVTHNHQRDTLLELYHDADAWFLQLDGDPDRALRHLGSPFAPLSPLSALSEDRAA